MFNYQNAIAFNHATWPTAAARVVRIVVVVVIIVFVLFAIAVVDIIVAAVSVGHL